MNETTVRVTVWTPRLLCIAFAVFLGIFTLDVFSMQLGARGTALALLMHLIPAIVVIAILAVAWRREWIAAVLFPLLAGVHVAASRGAINGAAYVVIDGPLIFIGILFLVSWNYRTRARAKG